MEKTYYSKNDKITHVEQSHEYEISLFKRYYAGDPNNMSRDALAARDEILTNNLRYAAQTALRMSKRRQHHQELTSAANYGLVKALDSRRHVPTRGRFTTFATKFILGEIRAVFRVSGAVSFPSGRLPDWPKDGSEDPDVETLADPCSFSPGDIDHSMLRERIAALPEQERQIIELIFFHGHSVKSAAPIVGVGRQWATRLRDRALDMLRNQVGATTPKTQEGK